MPIDIINRVRRQPSDPWNIVSALPSATAPRASTQTIAGMHLAVVVHVPSSGKPIGRVQIEHAVSSEAELSQRPIIQSPLDPQKPHPSIPQPYRVDDKIFWFGIASSGANKPIGLVGNDGTWRSQPLSKMKKDLNELLRSTNARSEHEKRYFSIANTRGMRGVIAKRTIPIGTPLIYAAQALTKKELDRKTSELAKFTIKRLGDHSEMSLEKAHQDADKRIASYSWEGFEIQNGRKKTQINLNGFGASNIAALVRSDATKNNMTPAYITTTDKNGKQGPQVMVYIANQEINQGHPILTEYGKEFSFTPSATYELKKPTAGLAL